MDTERHLRPDVESVQAVPLYLSEIAPPKWRGSLSIMFQSATTVGILSANLINFYTGKVTPNGWRISLGLAAIPAVVLTLGGIFLPDTPNSLVERGHVAEARELLKKVRGVDNVDVELEDLQKASALSRSMTSPWRNLLLRRYRPQLVMALLIPAFQQLGGNNAITFYAPVLFKSIGFGSNSALLSAVILGVVKVTSTWLSMLVVDRWGRKALFYLGGIQMTVCQVSPTSFTY
jgi:MFS family permease